MYIAHYPNDTTCLIMSMGHLYMSCLQTEQNGEKHLFISIKMLCDRTSFSQCLAFSKHETKLSVDVG